MRTIEVIQNGGYRDVKLFEDKQLMKVSMNKRPEQADSIVRFWRKKYNARLK